MKTIIKEFNVNWLAIKDACMQTIGKAAGVEPDSVWKRKMLICRHSPIRRSLISIKWDSIPSYVSTHISRHSVGVTPYIQTSREDRTGVPREERKQTDNVAMQLDMNIQSLFNISEKRLCTCSDVTTRKYWESVVEAIKEYDEDIYWALTPQCIRAGACVEPFSNCKYFEKFAENLTKEELTNVMVRYDKYNEYRDKKLVK